MLLPQSPRSWPPDTLHLPTETGFLEDGVASVISIPWVWDKVHAGGKTGMESTVPGPLEVSRSGGGGRGARGGLQAQIAGSNLERLQPQSFQTVSS